MQIHLTRACRQWWVAFIALSTPLRVESATGLWRKVGCGGEELRGFGERVKGAGRGSRRVGEAAVGAAYVPSLRFAESSWGSVTQRQHAKFSHTYAAGRPSTAVRSRISSGLLLPSGPPASTRCGRKPDRTTEASSPSPSPDVGPTSATSFTGARWKSTAPSRCASAWGWPVAARWSSRKTATACRSYSCSPVTAASRKSPYAAAEFPDGIG